METVKQSRSWCGLAKCSSHGYYVFPQSQSQSQKDVYLSKYNICINHHKHREQHDNTAKICNTQLKQGLFLQLWSTWTLVINFQILSLGNTRRDNIVSFDKDSWQSNIDTIRTEQGQHWFVKCAWPSTSVIIQLRCSAMHIMFPLVGISNNIRFILTDYQVVLCPHPTHLVPVVYFYQCSLPARDWNPHGFICP